MLYYMHMPKRDKLFRHRSFDLAVAGGMAAAPKTRVQGTATVFPEMLTEELDQESRSPPRAAEMDEPVCFDESHGLDSLWFAAIMAASLRSAGQLLRPVKTGAHRLTGNRLESIGVKHLARGQGRTFGRGYHINQTGRIFPAV